MKDISFSSKVWSTDDRGEAPAEMPAANLQDAADFQQMLHARPHGVEAGADSTVGSVLGAVNRTMHAQEARFDKTLKQIGKDGDPVASLELEQQLSERYLTHSLAVKVIGKGAQAIDTLMRLQ